MTRDVDYSVHSGLISNLQWQIGVARLLQPLLRQKGMGRGLRCDLLVMPLLVEDLRQLSLDAIRRCRYVFPGMQMSQMEALPLGASR